MIQRRATGVALDVLLLIVRTYFREAGCRKGLRLSHTGNAINKIIEDFLDDMTGRKK